MGKRRENRIQAFLPVRVSGTDLNGNPFTQTAHVIEVSRIGARLDGVRCLRGAGEIITIECSGSSAKFSVVWIGQPGSAQDGHFGVRTLQPERRVFRIALPEPRPDTYEPPAHLASPQPPVQLSPLRISPSWDQKTERRIFPRVRCHGTAQISQPGVPFPIWAKICDLSLSGCYLELVFTLVPESEIDLKVSVGGRTFSAKGIVVTSHPGIGIGVTFTSFDAESEGTLIDLVQDLRAKRRRGQASE